MSENGQKKVGAVLVQGGGIAGVQASLDLANSGFKVYLVEREAAIGGMMSHLDKTFPTGDCATYCNTDGKGPIEAAKCMGCGICVSECPARAIQLNHFETDQFRAVIEQLFAEEAAATKQKPATAMR